MTVPGVGPIVALTFQATVDRAAALSDSKTVGAAFGLTPRRFQPGERDTTAGISKCGDAMMRTALYEAAQCAAHATHPTWSWLKAWGCRWRAGAAPRRPSSPWRGVFAVILHRMWVDGTEFRWAQETAPPFRTLPSNTVSEH